MYLKKKKKSREESKEVLEESKEESKEEKNKKIIKCIEKESKEINYDLFKIHFNVLTPSVLAKHFYKTKDKMKNNKLVNVINSGLSGLSDEI